MFENYVSAIIPNYPPDFRPTLIHLTEACMVIETAVCEFYDITPDELRRGKNNSERAEMALHVIRYFLRYAGMGVRQISRVTAGDARNSIERIEGYLKVDEEIKGEIVAIRSLLRA